jgi:hypothetical protein
MQANVESNTIKQLMAEADELIRQINAGVLEEAEEDHRRRFEKHIQALEKIKSEGAGQMTSKGPLPKAVWRKACTLRFWILSRPCASLKVILHHETRFKWAIKVKETKASVKNRRKARYQKKRSESKKRRKPSRYGKNKIYVVYHVGSIL